MFMMILFTFQCKLIQLIVTYRCITPKIKPKCNISNSETIFVCSERKLMVVTLSLHY